MVVFPNGLDGPVVRQIVEVVCLNEHGSATTLNQCMEVTSVMAIILKAWNVMSSIVLVSTEIVLKMFIIKYSFPLFKWDC